MELVSDSSTTVYNAFANDHAGRKISTKQHINGQGPVTLNKLDYNEIGQLKQKHLHSTNDSTFLQHTEFAYNERGWLKESLSDQFSLKLRYNDAEIGTTPNY